MDVTQALKDVENLLRMIIESRLTEAFGADWISKCGVTDGRIEKWNERKSAEKARLTNGNLEERLIFYADFYDLWTILKKHWSPLFSEILGDQKTLEVYLGELGKLRDSDAHRRELLSHQKSLAIGISGEIRTSIIKWRSKMDTGEDCFPRIESARDSLGNVFPPPGRLLHLNSVHTEMRLRPGDVIDFSVIASDPLGGKLQYRIVRKHMYEGDWSDSPEFSYRVIDDDIGKLFHLVFQVASDREHHASSHHDDSVSFVYDVLPAR